MNILLFDVDGTICYSGKQINEDMANIINNIHQKYKIGIVGGGTFTNIIYQLNNLIKPDFIFSECGSVYHKLERDKYTLIYKNNLRLEKEYLKINVLVKECLKYISNVPYLISGHFIDLRNGLIYVSLAGMVATDEERSIFISEDVKHNYRQKLITLLENKSKELNISDYIEIRLGGSVGIAIYPKKWNKLQILQWFNENDKLFYFGDKYLPDGNDYEIINHPRITGYKVDSPQDTINILHKL